MIIQYLKSAWRNIWRNKLPSALNILGLAIGLSTGILAMLFSHHEFTYELCHKNADQLAKVVTFGNFGAFKQIPSTFPQVAIDLKEKYPEIENAIRTSNTEAIIFKENEPIAENRMRVVEPDFLTMFTFNFVDGGPFYTGEQSMVISETMAQKYFGRSSAAGKQLKCEFWGKPFLLTVAGVFEDLPSNTHLKAPAFVNLDAVKSTYSHIDGFHSTDFDVYCKLSPTTNFKDLNNRLAQTYELPVDIEDCKIALMPVKDLHLRSVFENNKANLYILFIGGIVALFIAIFNYITQSSILYSTRTQEVGVRLSNGGKPKDIFIQFMVDTFSITFLGFTLALLFLKIAIPYFNNLVDTDLSLKLSLEQYLIIALIFILTVLFSGFYPSLIMARLKPIFLLRSSFNSGLGKSRMRNLMTTIQFVIAIMLLQNMLITQKQGKYLSDASSIGYETENVVSLNGYAWGDLNLIKEELMRSTSIEAVAWARQLPGMQTSMTTEWKKTGNTQMANKLNCDPGYFDLFHIKMEEGRFFSNENEADKKDGVVVNQLLVESMGWEDALNKKLMVSDKEYRVLGVVSNYMVSPPIFEETPLIITQTGNNSNNLIIRLNPEKTDEALNHIHSVLRKANPNYPINPIFYSDLSYQLAKTFISSGTLVNGFVVIIILNAFLSLFGLSYFMAERSKKKIGVNKVFGASVLNIYWSLSKSFILRFAIAFTLITPLSYIFSMHYVSIFSKQMPITADIFILSGIMVLAMLMLSITYKIIKAANGNPVDALRYE
ncbi:MAG: ABC transporter permease [Salinivirgaceae bacterium]|jgi:putative ABC transport system permease protein|nr:ABC transporter permease [Salinivirgaceae bacterium]